MKNLPQLPYGIAAVFVWFLAGAVAFQMCNNANIGLLIAFLAAWFTWRLGTDKAKSYESALEDPRARLYALSQSEVLAATKEAVLHLENKQWCQNATDGAPNEDGNMKTRFVLTYEEELLTKPPIRLKRQLILDIKVAKVTSRTSVKLNYNVDSDHVRWMANEILARTTEMIWAGLDKSTATKGAIE